MTRGVKAAFRWLLSCSLALAATAAPVAAQPEDTPELAIRKLLSGWTEEFNAGNAAGICDLFARDLRYDYRGFPERGYDDMCSLLHRSLGQRDKKFAYSLDIKEIMASGDLALVRLVWTLRVQSKGGAAPVETKEHGIDVFRRQSDGAWRIVRFIAYEAP